MFGRKKQRIIETQKALILDLKEQLRHCDVLLKYQHNRILELVKEVNYLKAINKATDIDFPNSEKGGLSNTGAVNVSDILNL